MENTDLNNTQKPGKHWYLPLIIGILFILIGLWVFLTPAASYLALSMLFAATFVVSGLLGITYAISNHRRLSGWGWSLAAGIAELLIGILLLSRPELTVIILALFVGFAIMFRSITAIVWSFELKKIGVSNWGTLLVLGILGALFAFIMLWNPILAGLTIVAYTSLAFIVIGGFQVYFAIKLKNLK
ncbi:MAG TPA: DUF308 domain-containing protein [Fodinibius sp.]|nr:DUF308 domain-containing protein [Fodinibius sp.]